MKKIILLLSILLFSSCNNDDDNPIEQDQHETVATWHLISYERAFSQPTEYPDEITWVINPDNTINVSIEEGTDVNPAIPIGSNGSYPYSINDNQIIIDGITYNYLMSNTGTRLFIEHEIGSGADEMLIIFDIVVESN